MLMGGVVRLACACAAYYCLSLVALIFYLTLPYLTLPYLTSPYLTCSLLLPEPRRPHLLPYLTLPYLTLPHLTLPAAYYCLSLVALIFFVMRSSTPPINFAASTIASCAIVFYIATRSK